MYGFLWHEQIPLAIPLPFPVPFPLPSANQLGADMMEKVNMIANIFHHVDMAGIDFLELNFQV